MSTSFIKSEDINAVLDAITSRTKSPQDGFALLTCVLWHFRARHLQTGTTTFQVLRQIEGHFDQYDAFAEQMLRQAPKPLTS